MKASGRCLNLEIKDKRMRTVSLQTPQMPESGDGLAIVSSLSAKGSHLFNSLMYKILPNFKLFI